ncbi:MAG: WYL domain-containing protein, partial [Bacteroidales bacterium]
MIHRDKFCIWLVDLLIKRDLTLPQIQNAWLRSSSNIEGTILSERSFNRYRIHTEELFQIEILCKRKS